MAALIATAFNVILDCDETFNYWEPLHYLLYGDALKPWEYDAQFALRPYLFIYLLYIPAVLMKKLKIPKYCIFKACKFVLAMFSFWCLGFLSDFSISSLLAPGIFLQAAAFLPNSIACSLCALVLRFWQLRQTNRFLLLLALTAFLTWPYAAVFYSPLAFSVFNGKAVQFSFQLQRYLVVGLIAIVYIIIPILIVDYQHYGVVTVSWWNAIVYNVFGGNDEKFGVEPAHYYLFNGLLSYNLLFLVPILFDQSFQSLCLIGCLVVLSSRGHKEERFLYPLIPMLIATFKRALGDQRRLIIAPLMAILCLSRLLAIKSYYGGPEELFLKHQFQKDDVVCFKDQWYRFPSHFVLQNGRVGFLDSMQFDGILPQYYNSRYSVFNDNNRRSPTQFTHPDKCTLFVGLQSEFPDYKAMQCTQIIDPSHTKAPFRWLYLPGGRVKWLDYCIFSKI